MRYACTEVIRSLLVILTLFFPPLRDVFPWRVPAKSTSFSLRLPAGRNDRGPLSYRKHQPTSLFTQRTNRKALLYILVQVKPRIRVRRRFSTTATPILSPVIHLLGTVKVAAGKSVREDEVTAQVRSNSMSPPPLHTILAGSEGYWIRSEDSIRKICSFLCGNRHFASYWYFADIHTTVGFVRYFYKADCLLYTLFRLKFCETWNFVLPLLPLFYIPFSCGSIL